MGLYSFTQSLIGQRYREFLQLKFILALVVFFPHPLEPDFLAAPVHTFLNKTFPNRWIGRRGPIEWPQQSPDLSPLDYFLSGYLKSCEVNHVFSI